MITYKFKHILFKSNCAKYFCSSNSKNYKIYTKTGDKGKTSLIGGIRKNKDDEIFFLLGDIDELNSYLGLVR